MINPKDLFKRIEEIPRAKDFVKNPYIGKDGRYYYSEEALEEANRQYCERMFRNSKNLLKQ